MGRGSSGRGPGNGKTSKPKRSTEEELARLRLRTTQLQMKQTREVIVAYLDDFPALGPGCLKFLEDASGGKQPKRKAKAKEDLDEGDLDDPMLYTTPMAKKRAKQDLSASSAGSTTYYSSPVGDAMSIASEEIERPDIPRCYITVGSIPPKYLHDVISKVGEISLTKNALRGLCNRGGKHPPKDRLLELFEALTGLEPEDSLQPAFHSIEKLVAAMKDRHTKMNRWARDLRLPATWRSDGIYELVVTDAESRHLNILHRPLNKYHTVNPKLLTSVKDINGMHIEKNFSERRAQLVDNNGAFKCLVVVLCPSVAQDFVPLIPCVAADEPAEEHEVPNAEPKLPEAPHDDHEVEEDQGARQPEDQGARQPEGIQESAGTAASEEDFLPPGPGA
jgi:hypothetical protein